MTRDLKGELGSKKKQKMKELYAKYRVKRKGLKTMIEELKQQMLAKKRKSEKIWAKMKLSQKRRCKQTSVLKCDKCVKAHLKEEH